jgi:ABC-type multidrug transport system fused ATPase/permease subunit
LKKNNDNTIKYKISQLLPTNYKISSIQFIGFYVRFKDDILNDVNLTIRTGDRIVVTGSRGGGKRVMVYALMAIFEPKHIQGDILINGNLGIY